MSSVAERVGRRAMVTAAAILLGIKALLGIWGAFVLLTASRDDHKDFLGESIETRRVGLGLLVAALVVVTILVAVQLIRFRPWARLGAFVIEAVAIALAVFRFTKAAGPATVSILLSLVVIGLLLYAGRIPDND